MTVPYLGSKISLISKAEIRYEGILYSIDQNESTVALAKVKSFGTEDRPTDRPVPPRDEVFEYIIFRGRDIKDLHVCAPPQPMPHDPAIVQSSDIIASPSNANSNNNSALSPNIMGSYQSPQSTGMPPSQMMMYPSYVGHPPPPGLTPPQKPKSAEESPRLLAPIGHPSNKTMPGQQSDLNLSYGQNVGAGSGYVGGTSSVGGYEASGEGTYPSGSTGGYPGKDFVDESRTSVLNNEGSVSRDGRTSYRSTDEGKGRDGHAHKMPEGPKQGRYSGAPSHNHHYYQNQQYTSSHYRQYPSKTDFDQSAESYRGNRGHPRGGFRRPGGPRGGMRLKFEGEFDFESSNAQFDKEQIEKEIKEKLTLGGSSSAPVTNVITNHVNEEADEEEDSETSQEQQSTFYDKTKSFFDNLSSDATERERGKPNWREERKLNCETFGVSNSYSGGYHRGGRGYRSRGNNHYYGGRGWGYNGRGYGGDRGFNRGMGPNRRGRFNSQPQDKGSL